MVKRITAMLATLAGAIPATAAAGEVTGVTSLAVGNQFTCVVSNGAAKCWGSNSSGNLGDGTTTWRATPADVSGLGTGIAAVAAGTGHACALTTAGAVKCWGDNLAGQLGNASTVRQTTPVDVVGLASGVVAITAGAAHSCALTTAGAVKCWGSNFAGELGDGTTVSRTVPGDAGIASGAVAIDAGSSQTCAVMADGALKCWGLRADGGMSTVPMDIAGLGAAAVAVSVGHNHVCAVTSNGSARCWGDNTNGKLGGGTVVSQATPAPVSGLSAGVTAIATGNLHTCAVASGEVQCWGSNEFGQLGDASMTDQRFVPAPVAGLSAGAAGVSAGTAHSCALTSARTLRCWGNNVSGQLAFEGDNTVVPVPVSLGGNNQVITFAALAPRDLAQSPFVVGASASSALPVAFSSLSESVCQVSGTTVTLLRVGICHIAANQSGDAMSRAAPQVLRSFLVRDLGGGPAPRLGAISTRMQLQQGDGVLIGGFVIGGTQRKTVVVRARGPSLTAAGVANASPNTALSLMSGNRVIAANNNWQFGGWQGGAGPSIVASIGFAPPDPLDDAILASLEPGPYTVIVSDLANGVGLVEIFEMDRPESPFAGISTRGSVATGDSVMIAGFIVDGPGSQAVVVRGRGPSLASQGVAGPLANPTLQLVRASDQATLATNDDWGTAANAAQVTASGFAPTDARESAILITLPPGAYTAILSGAGGTSGIGIVEVYAVP